MTNVWARALESMKLEPIFGPKAWAKTSTCADVHPNGPMPRGTRCCCMACHKSGKEGHPQLRETAADKLAIQRFAPPEGGDQWGAADTAEPTRYRGSIDPGRKLTRKEKRALKFGLPEDPAGFIPTIDPDAVVAKFDRVPDSVVGDVVQSRSFIIPAKID